MNRREGFKAMNKNVIVLLKRDFNYKPKIVSNEDWEKRFEFFRALAREKTQMRHDLPPLLSRSLLVRFSLLMITFQFVLWSSSYFPLTLLFAGYSPFYICLSCSLSRSSRLFLLILAFFLTFLSVFLDSLDAFYFLLPLATLSLSFQPIFTQNPLSTNLNYNNFLPVFKVVWRGRGSVGFTAFQNINFSND